MSDIIRRAVLKELKRLKRTGYSFVRESMQGLHPVTVQKWLYSGRRVSLAVAERAMCELHLVVVPRSAVAKKRKP